MRLLIISFVAAAIFAMTSCGDTGNGKKTTPYGFEYVLHTDGSGQKAELGDYLLFHITQRNGEEVMFDTRDNGEEQIMEVTEGAKDNPIEDLIPLLTEGDSATINIAIDTVTDLPPDLQGVKSLAFDIKISEVQTKEEFEAYREEQMAKMQAQAEVMKGMEAEIASKVQATLADYKAGKLDVQETPEGLKYVIHEEGTGAKPQAGDMVEVNYYGILTDGTMFDNSFGRGQPFSFPVGQGRVIPGWDMGIPLLNTGGKATLFIPSELGYGPQGSPPNIPGGAELVFYVELNDIK